MTLPRMLIAAIAALLVLLVTLHGCAAPEVGLTDSGLLRPCPPSPNCVCSDGDDRSEDSFIPPLEIPPGEAPADAFERLAGLVGDRARIDERGEGYLHAVFTTSILRFKDDVELRLDAEARVVHVRSASRVGYSDLGKNRKRVEALRRDFEGAAPR